LSTGFDHGSDVGALTPGRPMLNRSDVARGTPPHARDKKANPTRSPIEPNNPRVNPTFMDLSPLQPADQVE
jgi:hypothetical protein